MPISRYQIRSELSLADPQLYRAVDRDDPEELLEGIAMGSLVGILRQLGDLSEFAAQIFHELHEEVISTAARGHGLMLRVQQLEAELPSIEMAFLSQSSHLQFMNNEAGVDWHANLRMDQNLITQGELPRYIMNSYEECRGPPRLFLLDKFDVAGAGACLKRYSDPSYFKTSLTSSGTTETEVEAQRKRKARKTKKKGATRRNGDSPQKFSTSLFNSRLNQWATDENQKMSEKLPLHGVKFKRSHLNGASFSLRNGKSYMECILKMHPSEDKTTSENSFCPGLYEKDEGVMTDGFTMNEETSFLSPREKTISENSFCHELFENHTGVSATSLINNKESPVLSPRGKEVPKDSTTVYGEVITDGYNLRSLPESISMFELDESYATCDREDLPFEVRDAHSKTESIVDRDSNDEFGAERIAITPTKKVYLGDYGSNKEEFTNRCISDEMGIGETLVAPCEVDQKEHSLDAIAMPGKNSVRNTSSEFEDLKTTATLDIVCQNDALVDGETKTKANADVSRSNAVNEKKLITLHQLDQEKDSFVDDEKRKDACADGYKFGLEEEKVSDILHHWGPKDMCVGVDTKDDISTNVYMHCNFEMLEKPLISNDNCKTEGGADGFKSDEIVNERIPSSAVSSSSCSSRVAKVGSDGHMSDSAASETDNYVDALNSVKSETETDDETSAKDVIVLLPLSHSSGNTNITLIGSDSLGKKEMYSIYSSDSSNNVADMQSPRGNQATSLEMFENIEDPLRCQDLFSVQLSDNSHSWSKEKSSFSGGNSETAIYLSYNVCKTEVDDVSPEKLTSRSDILQNMPPDFVSATESGKEESGFCSTHTGSSHSNSREGLNEIQLDSHRPNTSNLSSSHDKSDTDENPSHVDNNGHQSHVTEMSETDFAESSHEKSLAGEVHGSSSDFSTKSPYFTGISGETVDSDVLKEYQAVDVATELTFDNLQKTEACDLSCRMTHELNLEKFPTRSEEEIASNTKNLTQDERPCVLTGPESPDPFLNDESQAEGVLDSINAQENCSVIEAGYGFAPNIIKEKLNPQSYFQEITSEIDPNTPIRPLEFDQFCSGESHENYEVDSSIPTLGSGSEILLADIVEESSNSLELEERDNFLPERIYSNKNDMKSASSDALHSSTVTVSCNAQADDMIPDDFLVAADSSDHIENLISSHEVFNGHMKYQEECHTEMASNEIKQEISKLGDQEDCLEHDSHKIDGVANMENDKTLPESTCLLQSNDFDHLTPSEDMKLANDSDTAILIRARDADFEDNQPHGEQVSNQFKQEISELGDQEDYLKHNSHKTDAVANPENDKTLPESTCSVQSVDSGHLTSAEDMKLTNDSQTHLTIRASDSDTELKSIEDNQSHGEQASIEFKQEMTELGDKDDYLKCDSHKFGVANMDNDKILPESNCSLQSGDFDRLTPAEDMKLINDSDTHVSVRASDADLELKSIEDNQSHGEQASNEFKQEMSELGDQEDYLKCDSHKFGVANMDHYKILPESTCSLQYSDCDHLTAAEDMKLINDSDTCISVRASDEDLELKSIEDNQPQGEQASNQFNQDINVLGDQEDYLKCDPHKIDAVANMENDNAHPQSTYSVHSDDFHHLTPPEDMKLTSNSYAHIATKACDADSELKSYESNGVLYPYEDVIFTVPTEQGNADQSASSMHEEKQLDEYPDSLIRVMQASEDTMTSPIEESEHCESSDLLSQTCYSSKMGLSSVDPQEHDVQTGSVADVGAMITGVKTSSSTMCSTSSEPEADPPLHLEDSSESSPVTYSDSLIQAVPSSMNPSFPGVTLEMPESVAESSPLLQLDHCMESPELLKTTSSLYIPSTSAPAITEPNYGLFTPETTSGGLLEAEQSTSSGFPLSVSNSVTANLKEMPPLPPLEWREGKFRHDPHSVEEMVRLPDSFPSLPAINDENPQNCSLPEGEIQSHSNAFGPVSIIDDQKPQHCSPSLVKKIVDPSISVSLPSTRDEKPSLALEGQMLPQLPREHERLDYAKVALEGVRGESLSPPQMIQTAGEEKTKCTQVVDSNNQKQDLIKAIASHDRSMLRKASERVRLVIAPPSDDRNSLLEQIRTKSFNLKPTVARKPIFYPPKTNLNVVAILEKANAIRQAYASSDEDDDADSWSSDS